MSRQNLNYQLYLASKKLKTKLLRKLPLSFVPRQRDLSNTLQIGITTYIDRYENFFKPLYLDLLLLFPEVDIFVSVNGFFDQDSQSRYLDRLRNELCNKKSDGSTFVLHDFPVGLTRLWNEILSQGNNSTTLLLNDDLRVFPWFRAWIEKNFRSNNNITLINGTWSHLFFNRNLFGEIGLFDEDFRGIGFEDMDYTARCGIKGIEINNLACDFIEHKDHQPSRTSFDQISDTLWGPKYSSINHKYFFWKWKLSSEYPGVFIKQLDSFVTQNNHVQERSSQYKLHFQNGIYYPDRENP
jgi:hypothetical protein